MKSTKGKARPVAAIGAGVLAIGAAVAVTAAFLPEARAGMEFTQDNAAIVSDETVQTAPRVVTQPVQVQQQPMIQQQVAPQQVPQQVIVQPQTYPVYQQAQQPVVIQAPVQVPAQVQVGPAQTYEPQVEATAAMKKSEMMRKARESAERGNEDLLQERLEQLRLEDEKRRLDQLFGSTRAAEPAPASVQAPLTEQVVVTPVTNAPGQPVMAPVGTSPVGSSNVAVATDMVSSEDRAVISIQPRAGFSEMSGSVGYDVRPRISGGISMAVATTDNVSFELGYTYTEYGLALGSAHPFVQWAQGANYYNMNSTTESQAMKQNLFELGMKLHFLGSDARLRPFIGGGGAYGLSFVNYDQNVLDRLKKVPGMQGVTSDYQLSSYLGFLSTGLDMKVNKSISVGVVMKYFTVLSSRERSAINNAALYGGYPGYNGYNAANYDSLAEAEKQAVTGSLAKANFYSIMAGASFSF